jgi:Co/Zn/Cd efflux system component
MTLKEGLHRRITKVITIIKKVLFKIISLEYNENLYAIYIHIIADALGSVSVLISSFLIRFYGLNFTDPLCSLFISVMILYSVWPILKNSSCILLHILTGKNLKKKEKIEKAVLIMYKQNRFHL